MVRSGPSTVGQGKIRANTKISSGPNTFTYFRYDRVSSSRELLGLKFNFESPPEADRRKFGPTRTIRAARTPLILTLITNIDKKKTYNNTARATTRLLNCYYNETLAFWLLNFSYCNAATKCYAY